MKIIFILFFCANIIFGFAQSQEVPAFVTKVYNDLYKNLYSTKQLAKPVLQYFTEDKQLIIDYIAASGGQDGKIRVGSEFIKVLRSFGSDSSNALAFVLGHELAHVFLEQRNIDRIGSAYADKELRKKLKEVKDSAYTCIFERQADEQAMFFAHIGGYKVTHLAEDVLTKIYTHFKLKPNLKGYPSLEDRKEIAKISALKMSALLERFEIANLALVSGKYELASKIYNAIIMEGFKSAELYNNLGVSQMLIVIKSDNIYQQYEWPIFIDSKTKLSSSVQRDLLGIGIKESLSEAIKNFELATKFPNYILGNLNLSIAHLLFEISGEDKENNHLEDCKYFLSKTKSMKLPQTLTMEGIIQHYEKDFENAKHTFISNAESYPLSKRNLDKLFYQIQPVDDAQNPLNKILKTDVNLGNLFFINKNVTKDTLTKLLYFFSSTLLEKLNLNEMKCFKFTDRSIQNIQDKSIQLAEWNKGFESITETQLISFADQIYQSNLYTYYVYQDWVIRYDSYKSRKVYLIQ
jgi:hypothetical protein